MNWNLTIFFSRNEVVTTRAVLGLMSKAMGAVHGSSEARTNGGLPRLVCGAKGAKGDDPTTRLTRIALLVVPAHSIDGFIVLVPYSPHRLLGLATPTRVVIRSTAAHRRSMATPQELWKYLNITGDDEVVRDTKFTHLCEIPS